MNDTKIGVITSGIPYQYVKEALPEASVLKLGMVNPLPRKLIEDFAEKVDTLYIVEELDPVIETQVKSWGIQAIGFIVGILSRTSLQCFVMLHNRVFTCIPGIYNPS